MRPLIRTFLFASIVAVGVGAYAWVQLSYERVVFFAEQKAAAAIGLAQTQKGLAALADDAAPTAAIAVRAEFLASVGGAFHGKTVKLIVKGLGQPVEVTVKKLSITTGVGVVPVAIDVGVKAGPNKAVDLEIDGFLYFAGTSVDAAASTPEDPVQLATFKVMPVSIRPHFKYEAFDLAGRQFVGELLALGVFNFFTDQLAFPIPYHPRVHFAWDQPKSLTLPFGENNSGSIAAAVTTTPIAVERWLKISSPVFTTTGIVLAATLGTEPAAPATLEPPALDDPGTNSAATLLADTYAIQIDEASVLGWYDKAVTISLSKPAVEQMSSVAADALKGFSATIQSTAISGRFFDKPWSDDILGSGGFFAEASNNDSVEASLTDASVELATDPEKGPVVSAAMTAKVSADIHVHVDPLLGGGVGTTVAVKGSASPTIRAWIASAEIPVGDRQIGVVGPVIQCTKFDVTAKTDGKVKLGSGWATVPEIGAIVSQVIGKDPTQPTIVSGIPTPVTLLQPSTGEGGGDVKVASGLYGKIDVKGFRTSVKDGRFVIAADAALSVSDTPTTPLNAEELLALRQAATEGWNARMQQNCPDPGGLRVFVGDLEFGPNNEIIKFLRNAWSDITKGPGENNEGVKALKAATDAMNAAGETFDEATQRAVDEMNGIAKTAFGENSVAAHAVQAVTDLVKPPSVGVSDKGGVTVEAGGTSVSTHGEHGGLGVTVETPFGGVQF